MNTLHLFGDSYTQGHHHEDGYPPYIEWKKIRGGILPKTWAELLSEKLSMDLLNNAIAGSSNHEIFHTICQECDKFKKDDIVIVNWTYMHRFRWALEAIYDKNFYVKNRWKRSGMGKRIPGDDDEPSDEIKEKISVNRLNPLYVEEIYEYEKILNRLSESIGFDVYYWSADNTIIHNLPQELLHQKKYILHNLIIGNESRGLLDVILKNGGDTITIETKQKINDGHLGEIGHKIQADLFYDYITNLPPIPTPLPKKII